MAPCWHCSAEEAERIAKFTTAAQVDALLESKAFQEFMRQKYGRAFRNAMLWRQATFCCAILLFILGVAYVALNSQHDNYEATKALESSTVVIMAAASVAATDKIISTAAGTAASPELCLAKPAHQSSATVIITWPSDDCCTVTSPSCHSTPQQQQPHHHHHHSQHAGLNTTAAANDTMMFKGHQNTRLKNLTEFKDASKVLMNDFLLAVLAPSLPSKDSAAVCAAPAPPSPAAEPPQAAASMMDVLQVMMGSTLIIDVEAIAADNRTTLTTAIINSNNNTGSNGNHLNTTRQRQGLRFGNGFQLWHRRECVRYHQQSS